MDDYAGRVLADRYRLPLPPSDEYELVETRAFDTYSGQEVLVRQVPLPEVVDAEVVDADGAAAPRRASGRSARRHTDPAVRRAIEAAQSAAQIPDHPRLDQVFDVFAEAGSLWIVSELVAARPLAALLAERPLNPFRAAEIASDVLTAVRVVHAHGWTHRNITVRTVLVCDDGRVVLTGLAAGAAEEALCGYAPVPEPPDRFEEPDHQGPREQHGLHDPHAPHEELGTQGQQGSYERLGPPGQYAPTEGLTGSRTSALPYDPGPTAGVPGAPNRAALGTGRGADSPYDDGTSSGTSGAMPRPHHGTPGIPAPYGGQPALPGGSASGDIRAARAGAIAAYRAGARAAARATEDQGSVTSGTSSTGVPAVPGASGGTAGSGGPADTGARPPVPVRRSRPGAAPAMARRARASTRTGGPSRAPSRTRTPTRTSTRTTSRPRPTAPSWPVSGVTARRPGTTPRAPYRRAAARMARTRRAPSGAAPARVATMRPPVVRPAFPRCRPAAPGPARAQVPVPSSPVAATPRTPDPAAAAAEEAATGRRAGRATRSAPTRSASPPSCPPSPGRARAPGAGTR